MNVYNFMGAEKGPFRNLTLLNDLSKELVTNKLISHFMKDPFVKGSPIQRRYIAGGLRNS